MHDAPEERRTADLSARSKPSLKRRAEVVALAAERSVGWVLEKCLEAHLPVLEKQHGIKPPG
jgi:hypothetical protein